MKEIDEISGDVVDVAWRMHCDLGPGLLESVYEAVLAAKLERLGYRVACQAPVAVPRSRRGFVASSMTIAPPCLRASA